MLTLMYRWLVEFVIVGIFVLSFVASVKIIEMTLSPVFDEGWPRAFGFLLFFFFGYWAWKVYNKTVRLPLRRFLPK